MEGTEQSLLLSTGIANSKEFESLFLSDNFHVASVLCNDKRLRIRDCAISEISQLLWLDYKPDIDGIVATIPSFASIRTPLSYLGILPRCRQSLIPVFNIVRKHLLLASYTRCAFQYLKWSVSIKLFDGEGYDFHLALLPKDGRRRFRNYKRCELENMQFGFYDAFRKKFSSIIQNLPPCEISRNTFKKSTITDVRRMHVLPGDREFILHLLDLSLTSTEHEENFEPIIIAFKMGDRDSSEHITITAFDVSDAVISVHAAIVISSSILDQHLLWSRYGIQEIVGERGTVLSSLTLSSCCNFQSNLDGSSLDLPGELRRICYQPETIRFIQFYADTPHISTNSLHPVFGSIVSCGVLHHKVLRALENKCEEYLNICKENTLKLNRIDARMEIVCLANTSSNIFKVQDYISVDRFREMISKHPLIVPFADKLCQFINYPFTTLLRSVPGHIYETLVELYTKYKRKGGFFPVWKAYQYEVANEVFWKGRPNAAMDNTYAVNLGPGGALPSRSVTWQRGFLCLEDSVECALNEMSTPPLTFCNLTDADKNKLRRVFTFIDVIHGSINVVGKRAVMILLQDLLADPTRKAQCDRGFISDLKSATVPAWGRVSGTLTLQTLIERLCNRAMFKHPYVFGRVVELMEEYNLNLTEALTSGFLQTKLHYFPDIRTYDSSRNPKIHWPRNGLIKLVISGDQKSNEDCAGEISREVISFLENHRLVYQSKFVTYLEDSDVFSFPWMYDLLLKLSDLAADRSAYIELMSFLTCVALIENHWYVDYRRFQEILGKVQSRFPNLNTQMQQREVFSKFLLPIFRHKRMFRLHESIPVQFDEIIKVNSPTTSSNEEKIPQEDTPEDVTEGVTATNCTDSTISTELLAKAARKHSSAGIIRKWTPPEMEVMDNVIRLEMNNERDAYNAYLNYCDKYHIEDRCFSSFRAKYRRLKKV